MNTWRRAQSLDQTPFQSQRTLYSMNESKILTKYRNGLGKDKYECHVLIAVCDLTGGNFHSASCLCNSWKRI